MSSISSAFAPTTVTPRPSEDTTKRRPWSASRFLTAIWCGVLLQAYNLTEQGGAIVLPRRLGQFWVAGIIVLLLIPAVARNPRLRVVPSTALSLYSLLVLVSLVPVVGGLTGAGSAVRSLRLGLLVLLAWLISYEMAAANVDPARIHLQAFALVLGCVALGIVLFPGLALGPPPHRLSGVVPALTSTQVGQASALVIALAVLLRAGRRLSTRAASILTIAGLCLLVLSKTRTAFAALIAGLLVALASLANANPRARRMLAVLLLALVGALTLFNATLMHWLARGQTDAQLANVSGRRQGWTALLNTPRGLTEQLFGVGIRDGTFNGRPIDSGYLTAYHEEGFIGLSIVLLTLILLLFAVLRLRDRTDRAIALFLIVDVAVSSYAETGLSTGRPYLLHVMLVAFLVARHRVRRRFPTKAVPA